MIPSDRFDYEATLGDYATKHVITRDSELFQSSSSSTKQSIESTLYSSYFGRSYVIFC